MKLYIERIEKKFYRTNSDKHRLDELQREMNTLKEEKTLIAKEFKDRQKAEQSKPFVKMKFHNVLNQLKDNNNEIDARRKKLIKVLSNREKTTAQDKIGHKLTPNIGKNKVQDLTNVNTSLVHNEIEKEQLVNKLSNLTADISVIRRRIVELSEKENVQSVHLKSISDKKLVAKYKEIFSFHILDRQQKSFKENVTNMGMLLDTKQFHMEKNKNAVERLYENCALMNMEYKKLSKEHEDGLQKAKELDGTDITISKLEKNQTLIAKRTEKMHKIVNSLTEGHPEFVSDLEESTILSPLKCEDPSDFNYFVHQIINAYKNALHIINRSHNQVTELQLQIERKKEIYKEFECIFHAKEHEQIIQRDSSRSNTRLENTQLYINVRDNTSFLVKCKNFIISFVQRLHKVIDSINKVCLMLDFEYQCIILCPFSKKSLELKKDKLNVDLYASQYVNNLNETNVDQLCCTDTCTKDKLSKDSPSSNLEALPPLMHNLDPKTWHGVIYFYDDIMIMFRDFSNYLTEINTECQGDFQHRKVSISTNLRPPNKKKVTIEKSSIYKSRNTNFKDRNVR